MAHANGRGQSWAGGRVVLGGLSIASTLLSLATGTTTLGLVFSIITVVLAAAILFQLYRPESSRYYAGAAASAQASPASRSIDEGTASSGRQKRRPLDVDGIVVAVGPGVPRPGTDAPRVAAGRGAGPQVALQCPHLLLAADGPVAGHHDRGQCRQAVELGRPPQRVALPAQRGGPEAAHGPGEQHLRRRHERHQVLGHLPARRQHGDAVGEAYVGCHDVAHRAGHDGVEGVRAAGEQAPPAVEVGRLVQVDARLAAAVHRGQLEPPVPPACSTPLPVSTARRTGRPMASTSAANGSNWSGTISVSTTVTPSGSTMTARPPRRGGRPAAT